MGTTHRNSGKDSGIPVGEVELDESDARRDGTISRLRNAIIQDKFTAVSLSAEKAGSDPYNSGVHRALDRKANPWDKRSR